MVFTLSDDSTISLLNARISLKGERGITPYEFATQKWFCWYIRRMVSIIKR